MTASREGGAAPQVGEGALAGITVVDFSQAIVGPTATMLMGDFGAEKRGNITEGVGGNPTLHILMWKTKNGDDARPKADANGTLAYADGSTADIYSVSNDLTGAKGWRQLGRCTDLKK